MTSYIQVHPWFSPTQEADYYHTLQSLTLAVPRCWTSVSKSFRIKCEENWSVTLEVKLLRSLNFPKVLGRDLGRLNGSWACPSIKQIHSYPPLTTLLSPSLLFSLQDRSGPTGTLSGQSSRYPWHHRSIIKLSLDKFKPIIVLCLSQLHKNIHQGQLGI